VEQLPDGTFKVRNSGACDFKASYDGGNKLKFEIAITQNGNTENIVHVDSYKEIQEEHYMNFGGNWLWEIITREDDASIQKKAGVSSRRFDFFLKSIGSYMVRADFMEVVCVKADSSGCIEWRDLAAGLAGYCSSQPEWIYKPFKP
jgi:hypothetical protein